MTLSERNTFFKLGMVFCAIVTLLVIAASFLVIPMYSTMEENSRHPPNLIQFITGLFLKTDYLAVHSSIALAVLFALISLILIHSFFERTSAQEILYISFFTFSLSLEAVRLIVPLHLLNIFPMFYLITAARILLFARYFAIFSLFAASICAAGLEVQKTRNMILFLIVPALVISLGAPIDVQSWDTGFVFIKGYTSMFSMIKILAFITTTANFFVAVKVRNSKEYIYVAIGVGAAMAGRYVLIGTDNWAGSIAGILLLVFGTWFVCSKLHKIHLWL